MSNRTRGVAASVVAALALSLAPNALAATTVTASLARLTQTSTYSPPSPDPMGVTYVPWTGHLLISDSEVEEIPSLYTGKNLFETTLDGRLLRAGTTMPWSTEPTEVTVDAATQTYFFADDDADKVFVVKDGVDDLVGTADDQVTSFSTRPWNNTDFEGVAFGAGDLWLIDGVATEIYRLDPGVNGVFDGVAPSGDDAIVGSFDIGAYHMDPEGIDFWAAHGTIAVVSNIRRSPITEFAPDGTFVRSIDTTSIDIRHSSGLAIGPSSADVTRVSAYVTDRAVDNDFDPSENDGKLYELALAESTVANAPPHVVNPGPQTGIEGDDVTLHIAATDADNHTLSYTATGLPTGLGIGASTGLISGTVATGAAAASPYAVNVAVSDGIETTQATFSWTIRDIVPPAAPTGLRITGSARDLALDWDNNTEADLAGYRVLRSASAAGPWTLLTGSTPIVPSELRDPAAPAGATSYYRVMAVDRSINESAPAEASAARSSIVFRSASKGGSKSATLSIARPAGITSGDVLVASIAARGSAPISAPAGWVVVENRVSGTTLRTVAFLKVAGASEPTGYTFTLSAGNGAAGVIASYAGVNTSSPLAAANGSPNAASSAIAAPSISTTSPNSLLVGVFATATGATVSPPAGMVEAVESLFKSGPRKVAIELSDQVIAAAASTGPRTASASKAAVNIGLVLALSPAP
jgi:hypothetical protein